MSENKKTSWTKSPLNDFLNLAFSEVFARSGGKACYHPLGYEGEMVSGGCFYGSNRENIKNGICNNDIYRQRREEGNSEGVVKVPRRGNRMVECCARSIAGTPYKLDFVNAPKIELPRAKQLCRKNFDGMTPAEEASIGNIVSTRHSGDFDKFVLRLEARCEGLASIDSKQYSGRGGTEAELDAAIKDCGAIRAQVSDIKTAGAMYTGIKQKVGGGKSGIQVSKNCADRLGRVFAGPNKSLDQIPMKCNKKTKNICVLKPSNPLLTCPVYNIPKGNVLVRCDGFDKPREESGGYTYLYDYWWAGLTNKRQAEASKNNCGNAKFYGKGLIEQAIRDNSKYKSELEKIKITAKGAADIKKIAREISSITGNEETTNLTASVGSRSGLSDKWIEVDISKVGLIHCEAPKGMSCRDYLYGSNQKDNMAKCIKENTGKFAAGKGNEVDPVDSSEIYLPGSVRN